MIQRSVTIAHPFSQALHPAMLALESAEAPPGAAAGGQTRCAERARPRRDTENQDENHEKKEETYHTTVDIWWYKCDITTKLIVYPCRIQIYSDSARFFVTRFVLHVTCMRRVSTLCRHESLHRGDSRRASFNFLRPCRFSSSGSTIMNYGGFLKWGGLKNGWFLLGRSH